MKTFQDKYKRFGLGLLGAAALVVATTLTTPVAVGDNTIGSLPSADDGDGTQNFYLRTPRALADDVIVDAWGEGFYVVVALPDEELWIEFYGDVTVQFDRDLLAAQSDTIQVGLSAGFIGGGMIIVPEIDEQLSSRRIPIDAGFSLATPYKRIGSLLGSPLSFHTTQVQTGLRAKVEYLAFDGLLVIQQDIK